MESLRNRCTGRWPVHSFRRKSTVAAALIFGAAALLAPVPAAAQSAPAAAIAAVARPQTGQSVADFYKARKGAPLWLSPQAGDAARAAHLAAQQRQHRWAQSRQVQCSRTSGGSRDGTSEAQAQGHRARGPGAFGSLRGLCRRSEARIRASGITWVDPQLRPAPPSALAALLQAASAPSLPDYVREHGLDAPILRRASRGDRPAQI